MAVSKLSNIASLLELQAKINELIGELTGGGLGVFAFHVSEEGELILSFSGDLPPNFEIVDNNLVYTFNEGPGVNLGRVVGLNGADGKDGTNGTNGSSTDITSVTAIGLAAGASPTVTLGGTTLTRTIQFGIPAGQTGAAGASVSAIQAVDLPTAISLSSANPNNIYFVR